MKFSKQNVNMFYDANTQKYGESVKETREIVLLHLTEVFQYCQLSNSRETDQLLVPVGGRKTKHPKP